MRFIFFWIAFYTLCAQATVLDVPLSTTSSLIPCYLAQFQTKDARFSLSYITEIETILREDMLYDGRTYLFPVSEQKEKQAKQQGALLPFNADFWEKQSVVHLVKATVADTSLDLQCFNVETGAIYSFSCPLTGDLNTDRTAIHNLADQLTAQLYGAQGVCSLAIFYALKTKPQGEWISDIWQMDSDGQNGQPLLENNSYCIHPLLLPYKTPTLLYTDYAMGEPKLFILTNHPKKKTPLIPLKGNQFLPTHAAKGRILSFICDVSGKADLFVQRYHPEKGLIGKPVQAYSFPKSVQASPTIHPDGKQIAFCSDKGGTPRIYVIPTPSFSKASKLPNATLLTRKYRENTSPSWSPDGSMLAYSAKVEGTRQIFLYDFATKEELQLTSGPLHKENPSWAPNSLHLAYNTADHTSEIFVINIVQKIPRQVTHGKGFKHYPSWGKHFQKP